MMPVFSTSNIYTPTPTLVATAIPGNNTLRVNPTNVPPPVSNVEINNDNHGAAAGASSSTTASASTALSSTQILLSPFVYTTPTSLSAGAQNIFLTHLLSQDGSPEASGVLDQYEKLVALSFVKYGPSNASLPEPEPASIFGRVLQQEKQQQSLQHVVQQAAQQTAAAQSAAPAAVAIALPKTAETPATAKSTAQFFITPKLAADVYQAVIARNNAGAKKSTDEPVEAIN